MIKRVIDWLIAVWSSFCATVYIRAALDFRSEYNHDFHDLIHPWIYAFSITSTATRSALHIMEYVGVYYCYSRAELEQDCACPTPLKRLQRL